GELSHYFVRSTLFCRSTSVCAIDLADFPLSSGSLSCPITCPHSYGRGADLLRALYVPSDDKWAHAWIRIWPRTKNHERCGVHRRVGRDGDCRRACDALLLLLGAPDTPARPTDGVQEK